MSLNAELHVSSLPVDSEKWKLKGSLGRESARTENLEFEEISRQLTDERRRFSDMVEEGPEISYTTPMKKSNSRGNCPLLNLEYRH
jgi:hypothetical protein